MGCPSCSMAVTKEDLANQNTQRSECHKMLCRHCGTRFCFKCLALLTDEYTCGCSIDAHGFVNPHNGRRIEHFRSKVAKSQKKALKQAPKAKAVVRKPQQIKAVIRSKPKVSGRPKAT